MLVQLNVLVRLQSEIGHQLTELSRGAGPATAEELREKLAPLAKRQSRVSDLLDQLMNTENGPGGRP
jgi:hypothetical protein